jgi:probable HAF family extracellular repeat protein
MSRHFSPFASVFTLSVLALGGCDQSPIPTAPEEPASSTAAAALSYTAQDLGISGEFATSATSINDAGQVVGYWSRPDDVVRGFLWMNGIHTSIGTLGGDNSRAMDINNAGHVVGFTENGNARIRAFLWMNGTMRSLGTLGGNVSRAFAINNKGIVVGESRPAGNRVSHAFLLKNGVMTDLGTLGGANSAALDINEAGQVVGWSQTRNGTRHPFLWENGVMKDLLPLGSASTGTAYAINEIGVVVGERSNRAFRYSGGVMRNVPLGTTGPSVATGIRNGRIVGNMPGGGFVAVGSELTLLPLLPGHIISSAAYAINATGTVVGQMTQELDDSCPNGGCAEFPLVTMWTLE